jgi:predicted HTH domain antitoxin
MAVSKAETATISFEIPIEAFARRFGSAEEFAHELRLAAAVFWYHRAEISMERAAQIAGLDRTEFLLTLAGRQLDTVVIDFDDLDQELARARAAGH